MANETAQEMITVKYTGNADPGNSNAKIILKGREDLNLDGIGEVTEMEFARLTERGLQLQVMSAEEVKEEESTPKTHDHGGAAHFHDMDFTSKSVSALERLADEHDLDVKGTGANENVTKKDLEDALAAAHA